ncbi:rRNA methyltransferase [Legionella rubrilucens]|uniref:16S rRNA (cytosine(967)-C(5))-methyltransferase n=1 Tax=Legionella rubrilucens TaxID=458 RepID=A0A0W0XQF5_9GAMM|nr:16S rRNA (cytosine(967)-C(5))-methyltransferase RsmB [Legionella rubrilucens]KTD46830.1 rRNA methyltransferase [Legionella rubrilucens]
MSKNDRLQALNALMAVFKDNTPLSYSLSDASPLAKEIAYGVCRHYFRLQCLGDSLLKKRPKPLEVWMVVVMGLYQLLYLNKPIYATVKETVALLAMVKQAWAKGLVNAVLRNFCREKDDLLAKVQTRPEYLSGHPDWLVKRLQQDWPQHWEAIMKANDQHPPMSLRVNQLRSSREDYLKRLQDNGIAAHAHSQAAQGIALEQACDVWDLPGFAEGDVSVQDESAQLAVTLLDLQPGLRVLDACCAPGGKTCHILETETRLKACVALDVDAKRLMRVNENLSRLHLKATVLQGDGLDPSSWWDGECFDRILLDAPCSALGVIRRHPDIKLLRSEKDVREAATLQKALLQALWPLLAPKGVLVYATCSILPVENEQQIAAFAAHHSDCEVLTREQPWGIFTGHGWQIMPGEGNRDGFFYSVLRKG